MAQNRLTVEIAVLLCAKLVALGLLYHAFFSPAARPAIDSRAVAIQLLGSGSHR